MDVIVDSKFDEQFSFKQIICTKDCTSVLKKYQESISSPSIVKDKIKELRENVNQKLVFLESSLKEQLLGKLKKDSKEMLNVSSQYHKDLSKYEFTELDDTDSMMKKNQHTEQ